MADQPVTPVKKRSRRFYYMDILNIIATIAVMWLHTSEFAFQYTPGSPRWVLSLVIQIAFIWAVPIFFMISGANLFNYRERYDTKTFFKKRWAKVLIPFIFWTFVWYAWNHFVGHNPDWSLIGFWNGLEYDTIQPIFWFFYFIIPIYLAVPFLSLIATKANQKVVEYIIALYVIGVGVINYAYTLFHRAPDQLVNNIPMVLSTGIGIFFVGWYLHNFDISKRMRHLLYDASVLGFVIMFSLTIISSAWRHETVRDAYSIFTIGGFLMPLGVWAWAKTHFPPDWQPGPKTTVWLKRLSGVSLGVYVIHEFVIAVLEKLLHLDQSSYYHMLALPMVVWVISVVIVLGLQKIPGVNRLLP